MVLSLAVVAGCSPPLSPPPPASAPTNSADAEQGPYENAWDSDTFSTFHHALGAPSGGVHTLTLRAVTDSPGGETVAIYLPGPTGEPLTGWRMFVVASTRGETATETMEFPDNGVQPVVVVIENASGRRFSGRYTLTVTD
jgi:hypothetical protein